MSAVPPTADWIARQITEAFPWDKAPRYLIRDRDQVYGAAATRRLRAMGIRDKPIAPGSPWQNGFAERLIGSIRRECVDHVVVLGEAHLRRILTKYAAHYNELRTIAESSFRHTQGVRYGQTEGERAQIPDSNDGGFPDPHPGGWDHLVASGHQGIWLHRLSNRPKSH